MTIAEQINVEELLKLVMTKPWHKGCEIIQEDGKVKVKYEDNTEHPPGLRKMPEGGAFMSSNSRVENGLFWDIGGDDFGSPEKALLAILQSPEPVDVNPQTFSLNLGKKDDQGDT